MSDQDHRQRQPVQQTTRDIISIFFFKKVVFVMTFVGLVSAALLLSFLYPPVYQVSGQLVIKPQIDTPLIFDTAVNRVNMENRVDSQLLNTILHLMKSPTVMKEVVLSQAIADPDDKKAFLEAVETLQDRLIAEPLSLSNIITVTLRGRDPAEITDTLNSLIDTFIGFHIQVNQSYVGRLEFFDRQTREFKERYTYLTALLADETRKLNVVNPDIQKENNLKLVKDLEMLRAETLAKVESLQQSVKVLRKTQGAILDDGFALNLPETLLQSFPALIEMEKTLAQLIINRQRAESDFQPSSKQVQDAKSQLTNMKGSIHRQLDKIIETTEAAIASHMTSILAIEGRAQQAQQENSDIASNSINLERLQLEQRLARENYTLYESKREEARINREKDRASFANISVASRPEIPLYPWFPQKRRIMMIALPLALILALGASAAAYALDQRVRTPHDIISRTKLRFLGSLDFVEEKTGSKYGWETRHG